MRGNFSLCSCCSTPWGCSISRRTSLLKSQMGMESLRGSGWDDPVIIHTFLVSAGRVRVLLVMSILSIVVLSSVKYSKLSSTGTHKREGNEININGQSQQFKWWSVHHVSCGFLLDRVCVLMPASYTTTYATDTLLN